MIDHGATWLLSVQPPWWVLTDYPDRNDALTLLDGALLVAYILATAAVIGTLVSACLAGATIAFGRWRSEIFHHLAQTLIPIAGCGVFLGLFSITTAMLKADGWSFGVTIGTIRAIMLIGAWIWVLVLGWTVAGTYGGGFRRQAATASVGAAAGIGVASWVLLFFVW